MTLGKREKILERVGFKLTRARDLSDPSGNDDYGSTPGTGPRRRLCLSPKPLTTVRELELEGWMSIVMPSGQAGPHTTCPDRGRAGCG